PDRVGADREVGAPSGTESRHGSAQPAEPHELAAEVGEDAAPIDVQHAPSRADGVVNAEDEGVLSAQVRPAIAELYPGDDLLRLLRTPRRICRFGGEVLPALVVLEEAALQVVIVVVGAAGFTLLFDDISD